MLSLGVSVSRWFSPRGHLTAVQFGDFYASLVGQMVAGGTACLPAFDVVARAAE